MRYVAAATGIFFVLGLLGGMPFEAVAVIAIFGFLAGAGFVGSRSGSRVAALRRAVFLNDTLIGYHETMPEPESDDEARP